MVHGVEADKVQLERLDAAVGTLEITIAYLQWSTDSTPGLASSHEPSYRKNNWSKIANMMVYW